MNRSEDTRERIISSARALFAEKGYDGATTSQIARRAGVAEGTIYRHFASKKDLFMACIEPVVDESLGEGLSKMVEAGNLRDAVRAMLDVRVRVFEEHLDTFNIIFAEAPYHPELAELMVNRVVMQRIEQARPGLANLLRSPELKRPPNFLFIGLGLTAAIWFILASRPRLDDLHKRLPPALRFTNPVTTENLVDDLTDLVLYGIAGQPSGGEQ